MGCSSQRCDRTAGRRAGGALPGRLRPASARCAAQRHLRRLHRHPGFLGRPRHARRVRRLHPHLRHAAGAGRWRDGGHLLRVAPRQAGAQERRDAGDRCRSRRAGRGRGGRPAAQAEEPLGGAGKGGRRRTAGGCRRRRSGRPLRRTQQGAVRQGDDRRHEPRHLRPSLQRDRQAAPGLARSRPRAGRDQDRHDRLGQRQGAAAPAHT